MADAKKHGVAGNRNPEKFKTPEQRQKIFKLFCEHMAAGYSSKNFAGGCVEHTVIKMLKDYPKEFDLEELEIARSSGRLVWEQIGKLGTTGKLKGFNASSWWRIMQNKMGWKDKMEHASDPENPLNAGGTGALTPEERAVLDHFKERMLYLEKHQGGIKKDESTKK